MTILSSFVLSSSIVSADDCVVDVINITVPAACTLEGIGMNSHNATINPGTYNSEVGTTTLKAFCNDSNGFAIYAIGYTNNTDGNNNLVSTTLTSPVNIPTGTATSGNSQWAMKLATQTSPEPAYPITIQNSFDSFHTVPDDYTLVAKRTAATDVGTNATGSILTTTYQVFISNTQPADTYTGKVKYVMVHPNTHSAPVACNPNATTISEVKCMQDFAGENHDAIMTSLATGTQYTLKDKRDGKEYTIAKLADGNVWMTQNLDLDLVAGDTYTNEDTDIGYNTTTGEYETAAWSPMRSTYATSNSQTTTWCQGGLFNTEYGYCEENDTPESYDPGDLYWNSTLSAYSDWETYYGTCDYSTSTPSCLGINPIGTYTSSTGTAQLHLGNYYNWTAAVAMNDSSDYDTSGELIEQSICPAGWTLPRIGNGDDSFQALWEEYGYDENDGFTNISNVWSSPLYFPASGYFNGVLLNVGIDGGFWSPVVGDEISARGAFFGVDGNADPSYYGLRGGGTSIRCVARPVVSSTSEGGGGGGNS